MPITQHYRNNQNMRRFFKAEVGPDFKFNRALMAWMRDTIAAYQRLK